MELNVALLRARVTRKIRDTLYQSRFLVADSRQIAAPSVIGYEPQLNIIKFSSATGSERFSLSRTQRNGDSSQEY